MKDIDTAAAPMISVPAGVLKEFIPSPNSRTPSPEVSSSTTSTSSSTTTVTRASASSPSPSQSPSPSLAASITTALQIATDNIAAINSNGSSEVSAKSRTPTPTLTSRTSSPALPHLKEKTSVTITSAATHVHVNGKVDVKAENNDPMEDSKTDSNDSNSMVNGLAGSPSSSPSANTTGVKRPNDDEENVKPDLKRIRVFPSVSEDGCKRELKITDKEVYEAALDLEYKKYEEVKNSNNQSLVTLRRIKNGIARLSGEKVPSTDSPSQSPSTSPSPAITSGPEGEDPATPGLPDLGTAPGKEQGLADKENVRTTRGRERKVNKNGLKDAILRVFSENTLYGSELGHLKQMCEKLTSTLEINMRKVAQFHKEIEDLRKVTTRLAAEHQARKGQYVAPIRIKRSVGIQAAPHIINKGIMHASVSGGNIKTISPRASSVVGVLPTSMGQNLIPGSTVGIITTSSGMRPATLTGIPASAPGIPAGTSTSLGTAVRTPNGQIMMMAPAGTMQPLTRPAAGAKGIVNRGSVVPKPGTLMKVPTSATAQLVPLQGGVGQMVLLPNASGGQPTTALIVSQVSTGQTQDSITNPAVAQARITTYVNHTSSATRVLANTSPAPARTSGTTPSPTTTMQQSSGSMKHPAPLPKTPFQQVGGISKKLPPQPTLKLSHKDSSIVLSWTMAKTEDHETIASYQLYAYQEGAAPPSANLWKKVGSVKALELPMACTLTQFMPGHVYHFAVRAVDTKSRLGPFSEPRSIKLDKK
ncbi:mucin-5AC-like isoform X4 [Eriocheir sinensis]|uniref:mucin-5AC-like isoform X4 n=1 Tax=Eriocheir sinensis TaxID=95602 RepID=UPI0021C8000C|nr:mucin-5AC-like isoform X4 [Eriocheir sinensis]